jgi:hypothetical protein
MPIHGPHFLLSVDVPNLDLASNGAHAEVAAPARPAQARDLVSLPDVAQLRSHHRGCVPDVHRRLEGHGENVLRGPVHQVQVEVIGKPWSFQYSVGVLRDLSGFGLLASER